MKTTTIDRLFAAGLLLLGLHIVREALGYGYLRGTIPGPGFFPFWVGLALAVLSLANLVRSIRGVELLTSHFDARGFYKALGLAGCITAFILAAPWLGMLLASGLLVPAIAFAIEPRWTTRLAVTVAALSIAFPVLCHFLFAVYLQVPLVRGAFGI